MLEEEIKKLLPKGRRWIEIEEHSLHAYIRVTERILDTVRVATLEVGSVEVDSMERGKGNFKKFLKQIEDIAGRLGRYVFIENVLQPKLCHFFKERGYQLIPRSEPPCFILEVTTNE